jgi:hypothetical protein
LHALVSRSSTLAELAQPGVQQGARHLTRGGVDPLVRQLPGEAAQELPVLVVERDLLSSGCVRVGP